MATAAEKRRARELVEELAGMIGTEPAMKGVSFDDEKEIVVFVTAGGTALSLPLDEFLSLYAPRH